MLQDIRRGARSWLGIVLACILIPPFAIVGVEYVFRDGFNRAEAVITVGQQEVLGREYERAFRQRLDALNRRSGASVDYRTAKSMGVVDIVAESFVSEAPVPAGDPRRRHPGRRSGGPGSRAGDGCVQGRGRQVRSAALPARPRIRADERAGISRRATDRTPPRAISSPRASVASRPPPAAIVDTIDRYRNEKRRAHLLHPARQFGDGTAEADGGPACGILRQAQGALHAGRPTALVSALIVLPEDVFDPGSRSRTAKSWPPISATKRNTRAPRSARCGSFCSRARRTPGRSPWRWPAARASTRWRKRSSGRRRSAWAR